MASDDLVASHAPLFGLRPQSLRATVAWLAAPEREGRAAGTAGAASAAQYIAEGFQRAGLKPTGTADAAAPDAPADGSGYFQSFRFPVGRLAKGQPSLHINGLLIPHGAACWEPAPSSGSGNVAEAFLVRAEANAAHFRGAAVVLTPNSTDRGITIAAQIAALRDQGAAAVVIAAEPSLDLPDSASGSDAGVPVILAAPSLAENWLHETARFSLRLQMARQEQTTANVVGILEGRDPQLQNEVVLLAAHYDHLGWGGPGSLDADRNTPKIHPGADDNASGAAVVMSLARAFASAPVRPKRSLVFACFSAEERGLLGSAHYNHCPPVPLERTVAMLNLDMVGRLRAKRLAVLGTGTSPDWMPLIHTANQTANFQLNTGSKSVTTEVGGSDHQTFIGAQIPTLFFFTGLHADYHKPTDTVDKINASGMARVGVFVAAIARAVADAPTRPMFAAPPAPQLAPAAPGSETPRPALGTMPEYGADVVGVRLSGVRPGSPAHAAGLRAGDVLTALGGQSLRGVEEYAGALFSHRPGDTIEIGFTRKGKPRRVWATLEESGGRR